MAQDYNQNYYGPNFDMGLPIYPPHGQIIRCTGTSVATGVYSSFVQQSTHAPGLRDREPCYLYDANGVGLVAGYYYCRLIDSYTAGGNTYPLFAGTLIGTSSTPGPPGPAGTGGIAYARVVTQSAAGTITNGGQAYTATATILTATSNAALAALDGVTLAAGDNLLFLLEGTAHVDYGLYTVTRLGNGLTPWILTRPGNYTTSVTGTANNGVGLVRLAVTSTLSMLTGQMVTVSGVTGTTEANGSWVITVIDATHIDLVGSAFVNAWISGGTVAYAVGGGTTPVAGQEVYISTEGNVNFNTVWQLATQNTITNGSTAQLWARTWPEVNWFQITSLVQVGGRYPANLYDKNLVILSGGKQLIQVVDHPPLIDGITYLIPFAPVVYQFYMGTRAYDIFYNGSWIAVYEFADNNIPFTTYTAGPIVTAVSYNGTTCTLTVTTKTLNAVLPTGSSINLL